VTSKPSEIWEIDNLPNRLTIFRITLIPIIVLSLLVIISKFEFLEDYFQFFSLLACATFILASITDFVDGYLARKHNVVTEFGSFLDPIADKLLVVTRLILLQAMGRIPVIITLVLVLREVYITSLRLLATNQNLTIPVGRLGKLKTALQMTAIPMLMIYQAPSFLPIHILGLVIISISAFFSFYSAIQYSASLVKKIKNKGNLV
jgi:CDP-diacylglycerol--glycerol-3-phosphate 3-phosphatidyltransferase